MTPQPASPWRKRTNTLRISARAARWCVLHTVAGWPATVPAATTIAASPVLGIAAAGLIGATGATTHRLQRWWWGWRSARIAATWRDTTYEAKVWTGRRPPRIMQRKTMPWGIRLWIKPTVGTAPAARWAAASDDLRAAWRAQRVSVDMHGTSRIVIDVVYDDPLSVSIERPSDVVCDLEAIPIGVASNDRTVTINARQHMLVGGMTGSGKSGLLACYLMGLVGRDDVALYLMDLKGTDLPLWRSRAERLATNIDQARTMLSELVAMMGSRQTVMAGEGCRALAASPESRQVVVIIDEVQVLAGDKAAFKSLISLVLQGRAAGITIVCATQRPSAEVLPTVVRDNLPQRLCLAMLDATSTNMVLGDGQSVTAPAHDLPTGVAGLGYLRTAGVRTATLFRTWWVPDSMIAAAVDGVEVTL